MEVHIYGETVRTHLNKVQVHLVQVRIIPRSEVDPDHGVDRRGSTTVDIMEITRRTGIVDWITVGVVDGGIDHRRLDEMGVMIGGGRIMGIGEGVGVDHLRGGRDVVMIVREGDDFECWRYDLCHMACEWGRLHHKYTNSLPFQ